MRRDGQFIELLLLELPNYAADKLLDGTLNWAVRILNPNRGDEDDPIWHLRKN